MPRRTAPAIAGLLLAGCAELASTRDDKALAPPPAAAAAAEAAAVAPKPGPAKAIAEAPRPDPAVDPASLPIEAPATPPPPAELVAAPPIPAPAPAPGPAPGPGPAPVKLVARPAVAPEPVIPALPPVEARPAGRAVARVGDEVITLPELTAEVKGRLAALPKGKEPTRRQVIVLARSILEEKIRHSLVFQEARGTLDGPGQLDATLAEIEARWQADEEPRLLDRERATDRADLASKLARHGRTIEEARDKFVVRELAADLLRRERGGTGRPGEFEVNEYLDRVRARRPIRSIMTQAEVAAASGDPEATRASLPAAAETPGLR